MFVLVGCKDKETKVSDDGGRIKVAVSIVPEETFVKAVAGDLVDVVTLIPPGKSPENYSPTPKEMTKFSEAQIYFTIGVPAEESSILPRYKDINKNVKLVDLAEGVGEVYPHREFAPGDRDPHIWLSPKRVEVMIDIIADELSAIDPENEEIYRKNANEYKQQLKNLDETIKKSMEALENKTIIVYHPAYGYFADDYGLTMLSLEEEGKEATIEDRINLINIAKAQNIKVIFYQAEVDDKQALSFAEEIGGKAVLVEPLAADYINNLMKMANAFVSSLE